MNETQQAPERGKVRIFKYPLEITDEQRVEIPVGARILTVQVQDGRLMLWAMVDDTAPTYSRSVFVVGTGHWLDEYLIGALHVGTVQMGTFVWHVFAENQPFDCCVHPPAIARATPQHTETR